MGGRYPRSGYLPKSANSASASPCVALTGLVLSLKAIVVRPICVSPRSESPPIERGGAGFVVRAVGRCESRGWVVAAVLERRSP